MRAPACVVAYITHSGSRGKQHDAGIVSYLPRPTGFIRTAISELPIPRLSEGGRFCRGFSKPGPGRSNR